MGFPGGAMIENLPATVGDARDGGSIPGLGRSPGGGKGNPLQYPCLENPVDRGAWCTVHGVRKSWIRMSDLARTGRCAHAHTRAHTHTHTHTQCSYINAYICIRYQPHEQQKGNNFSSSTLKVKKNV